MTTVQDLIIVICRHLQEGDLTSGLWSSGELIQYIVDADREFIAATGVTKQINAAIASVGVGTYFEPNDCIEMERVAWNGKKLYPQTAYELDRQKSGWRADTGTPQRYNRGYLPINQFDVWPKPATSGLGYVVTGLRGTLRRVTGDFTYVKVGTRGVLRSSRGGRNYYARSVSTSPYGTLRRVIAGATNFFIFYDRRPAAVTATNQPLATPDAFARYVMYRALEKAWAKEGEGQDVNRSMYCKVRFERGIQIALRLVSGKDLEAKHG